MRSLNISLSNNPVFSGGYFVTVGGEALRDDSNNSCEGDYAGPGCLIN